MSTSISSLRGPPKGESIFFIFILLYYCTLSLVPSSTGPRFYPCFISDYLQKIHIAVTILPYFSVTVISYLARMDISHFSLSFYNTQAKDLGVSRGPLSFLKIPPSLSSLPGVPGRGLLFSWNFTAEAM